MTSLSSSVSPRLFRPIWAEVNLSNLKENFKSLRAKLSSQVKILFVVKANGYGHGAKTLAREAQRLQLEGHPSADFLGVSSIEEGVAIRQAGIKTPVLILGSLYPFDSFLEAARLNLTPTVSSLEGARRLSEAGLKIKKRLEAHLKIDTGMGRVGVSPKNAAEVIDFLSESRGAKLSGIYTHFSSAESDPAYTRLQIKRFNGVLKNKGLKNGKILIHASNSAAILNHRGADYDMVRVGGALYGLWPGFKPLLSLKARIVFIKRLEKGASVSYGRTFRARRLSKIATVCAGYGDGVPRAESNKGEVLVAGRRCKIIGTVTMDMLMIDVTDIPQARVGSEVVLIGKQGQDEISAAEAAGFSNTISYEVVCAISQRVPRIYRK